MTENDRPRFTRAMLALITTLGSEATEARLTGYWFGLRDIGIERVELAVAEAIQTCKRLPFPADLRELATGGSDEMKAIAGWEDVQKAMPLGAYRHVDFQDRIINATIRQLGGWPAMFERCGSAEDEKWYRMEFIKLYKLLSSRDVCGDSCLPLAGLSQAEVINGVIADPVPVKIGCDESRLRLNSNIVAERFLVS